MQTLNLDGDLSPIKTGGGKNPGLQSMELQPFKTLTAGTKREERKPPASIANETMNLEKILERLQKSPATPNVKNNRAITSKYLQEHQANKENCNIF